MLRKKRAMLNQPVTGFSRRDGGIVSILLSEALLC
jgi:hypothetical protein